MDFCTLVHIPTSSIGAKIVTRQGWAGVPTYPICEQTNTCENITFPQLCWRAVKMLNSGHKSFQELDFILRESY